MVTRIVLSWQELLETYQELIERNREGDIFIIKMIERLDYADKIFIFSCFFSILAFLIVSLDGRQRFFSLLKTIFLKNIHN